MQINIEEALKGLIKIVYSIHICLPRPIHNSKINSVSRRALTRASQYKLVTLSTQTTLRRF